MMLNNKPIKEEVSSSTVVTTTAMAIELQKQKQKTTVEIEKPTGTQNISNIALLPIANNFTQASLMNTADMATHFKQQLFERLTYTLNQLQNVLQQYSSYMLKPIQEMELRIKGLRNMQLNSINDGGIWNNAKGVWEPMVRNIQQISAIDQKMWEMIIKQRFRMEQELSIIRSQIIDQIQREDSANVGNLFTCQRNMLLSKTSLNNNTSYIKKYHPNFLMHSMHPHMSNAVHGSLNGSGNYKNMTGNKSTHTTINNKCNKNIVFSDFSNNIEHIHPNKYIIHSENELEFLQTLPLSKLQSVQNIFEIQNQIKHRFSVQRTLNEITDKLFCMRKISTLLHREILQHCTSKVRISDKNIKNIIGSGDGKSKAESGKHYFKTEEVQFIKQILDTHPNDDVKQLFIKFRKDFPDWGSGYDCYRKFYQKHWRLKKEKKDRSLKEKNTNEEKRKTKKKIVNKKKKTKRKKRNHASTVVKTKSENTGTSESVSLSHSSSTLTLVSTLAKNIPKIKIETVAQQNLVQINANTTIDLSQLQFNMPSIPTVFRANNLPHLQQNVCGGCRTSSSANLQLLSSSPALKKRKLMVDQCTINGLPPFEQLVSESMQRPKCCDFISRIKEQKPMIARAPMVNHQLSFAPLISHMHNMSANVNTTVIAATSPIADGVQAHICSVGEQPSVSKEILSVNSKQTRLPLFPAVC